MQYDHYWEPCYLVFYMDKLCVNIVREDIDEICQQLWAMAEITKEIKGMYK